MTAPVSARSDAETAVPAIELRGVEKRFGFGGNQVQALDKVDLSIAKGEFVAIVGPSGCGKSTILKMVAGLYQPTSGEILVNGEPLRKPPDSLGVAFQQDLLLPWRTIMKNVMLKSSFRRGNEKQVRARAQHLIDLVGLSGFENSVPSELSGGMRQRAALCRALVEEPELLLLDEPFGALDAITRDQMALDLQRLWGEQRNTVILITHSIVEAVFLASRVIVLSPRPGRIQRVIEVDLERPRPLSIIDTKKFGQYAQQVRAEFDSMGLYQR